MVTFGWQSCRKLFAEPNLWDLINEQQGDLGVLQTPVDPDFARFIQLEDMGLFFAWVAREGDRLAGYIGWFVQPHLFHKTTLHAVDCGYLLSRPYRKGMTGYRMFSSALEALEEMGVKRVMLHHKIHYRGAHDRDQAMLFERLGFVHTDDIYSKALG